MNKLPVERELLEKLVDDGRISEVSDAEWKVLYAVLNETPKCQQIQPDEAALLQAGDYCAEELFGVGGVPTCPGCEHCNINKMFEAAYRAQATSPVFIVNDMLVKDADGEYFHLATRTAFNFFKLGRESWTN